MDIAPNRLRPVIIGTFVISAISIMPLINFINLFCCAGIIIGGAAGAVYYQRQLKNLNIQITTKDCAITGLLSGFLSAIIVTGINLLMVLYSDINPMNEILELLNTFSRELPQEVYDQMKHFSDEFERYGYSPTLTLISLIINLIIYPLFASIGGILVALISAGKNKTVIS